MFLKRFALLAASAFLALPALAQYQDAAPQSEAGKVVLTLEDALKDEAYRLPDDYVGRWGISWLHHWELTAGHPRSPSPDPSEWITQAYDSLQH